MISQDRSEYNRLDEVDDKIAKDDGGQQRNSTYKRMSWMAITLLYIM